MEYLGEILNAVDDEDHFLRLTLSGPPRTAQWQKIVISRIDTGEGRKLQAVLQGEQKQVAENIGANAVMAALQHYLDMGYRHINLQATDQELHIRITKKGKALMSRGKPSGAAAPEPVHAREKRYPFPAGEQNDFLEKIGVMRDGRVLARMQDKFRQINQFLMLLEHSLGEAREPIHIVDCGCGRAFLTLAAYHYLKNMRGMQVRLTGIDAEPEVIARAGEMRARLAFTEVEFTRSRILDYAPAAKPDIVLSLHACDTATDEAIAQGVKWGAGLILCAPCCQHELHHVIQNDEFQAVLRHGILRQRQADILTDALRAAALRVMGYRAEVIEFISPDATAKNLMIRAQKVRGTPRDEAVREYMALRDYWNVRPVLEELLGEGFRGAIELA